MILPQPSPLSSLVVAVARSVPAARAPSPSAVCVASAAAVAEAVARPVEVRLVVPVGPPRHRQARVVGRAPRV